jgi:hypothetical protein
VGGLDLQGLELDNNTSRETVVWMAGQFSDSYDADNNIIPFKATKRTRKLVGQLQETKIITKN